VVFGSPTFDKRHPDCAHFSEFEDCFVSVLNGLAEERSKFLVVEDLERAAGGDFADCCGVKSMVVVAVAGLNEDGAVRHTVGIHFAVQVGQLNTFPYVTSGVFDGGVSVDI